MDPIAASATDAGSSAAAVAAELAGILARLGELTDIAVADAVEGDRAVDAARVDAVALLERIQAAAAAIQAAVSVGFGRSQVATQQGQVLRDPEAVGRGIADQLALACHVSPSEGSRRFNIARALHSELPATAGLLRAGRISFYVAGLVVSQTRHLDPDRRRAVDAELAAGLVGCAGGSAAVAEVLGYGPMPAPLAREILAESSGRRWWRRLFTAPHGGVVGGDPTRRCFDGTLATLIGYRDGGRCREPFCDAPARHTDHIVPFRDGGPTTFTNGRATCVRSNQAREMPGWQVRLVHDGNGRHPHTVATTTPTGHTYTSRAGPAP